MKKILLIAFLFFAHSSLADIVLYPNVDLSVVGGSQWFAVPGTISSPLYNKVNNKPIDSEDDSYIESTVVYPGGPSSIALMRLNWEPGNLVRGTASLVIRCRTTLGQSATLGVKLQDTSGVTLINASIVCPSTFSNTAIVSSAGSIRHNIVSFLLTLTKDTIKCSDPILGMVACQVDVSSVELHVDGIHRQVIGIQ